MQLLFASQLVKMAKKEKREKKKKGKKDKKAKKEKKQKRRKQPQIQSQAPGDVAPPAATTGVSAERRDRWIREWGHYFGLPSLIVHVITRKWLIFPTRWNLWLTEKYARKYASTEPVDDGTFTFYIARKT